MGLLVCLFAFAPHIAAQRGAESDELILPEGHFSPIVHSILSPDRRFVITSGWGTTILWSVNAGKAVWNPRELGTGKLVAFEPNGASFLWLDSGNNRIERRRTATGEVLREFPLNISVYNNSPVLITPDWRYLQIRNSQIVSSAQDAVLDLGTGTQDSTLAGCRLLAQTGHRCIREVGRDSAEILVVTSDPNGQTVLRHSATVRAEQRQHAKDSGFLWALSPDGRHFLWVSDSLHVVDAVHGMPLFSAPLPGRASKFRPWVTLDNERAFVASDTAIAAWSLRDHSLAWQRTVDSIPKWGTEYERTVQMDLSRAGRYLIISDENRQHTQLWSAASGVTLFERPGYSSREAFSVDDKFAVWWQATTAFVLDLEIGAEIRTLGRSARASWTMSVTPDGLVATITEDTLVRLWDPATGAQEHVARLPAQARPHVQISSAHTVLLFVDTSAVVMDLHLKRELLRVPIGAYGGAQLSDNGQHLLAWGRGHATAVWDVNRRRRVLVPNDESFQEMTYDKPRLSRDGGLLALPSQFNITQTQVSRARTRVFNVGSADQYGHAYSEDFPGTPQPVLPDAASMPFSANGQLLVTIETEFTLERNWADILVHDVTTHEVVQVIPVDLRVRLRGFTGFEEALAIVEDDLIDRIAFIGARTGTRRQVTLDSVDHWGGQFTQDGRFAISRGPRSNADVVYDIGTGRELYRRWSVGPNDWIVQAPDGRFDGSPGGLRVLYLARRGSVATVPPTATRMYVRGLVPRLVGNVSTAAHRPITSSPDTTRPGVSDGRRDGERARALEEALENLTDLLASDPTQQRAVSRAYRAAADAFRATGDHDRERRALSVAATVLHRQLGRPELALFYLKRLLNARHPSIDALPHSEVYLAIGAAYEAMMLGDSARRFYERAHVAAHARADHAAQAVALAHLVELLVGSGGARTAQSRALAEAALAEARSSGVPTVVHTAMLAIARVMEEHGDTAGALPLYREVAEQGNTGTSITGAAKALTRIACIYLNYGTTPPDSILPTLQRAMMLARTSQDGSTIGWSALALGRVHLTRGAPSVARKAAAEALQAFQSVGDRAGQGYAGLLEGDIDAQIGARFDAAIAVRIAASLLRDRGNRAAEAAVLPRLAQTSDTRRQADSADVWLGNALTLFREIGDARGEAEALRVLADFEFQRGRADSAAAASRLAFARFQAADYTRGQAAALYQLGEAYLRLQQSDSAYEAYRHAATLSRASSDPWTEFLSFSALARLERRNDRTAGTIRAIAFFDTARAIFDRLQFAAGQRFMEWSTDEGAKSAIALADRAHEFFGEWPLAVRARAQEIGSAISGRLALIASERSRARALLGRLGPGRLPSDAHASPLACRAPCERPLRQLDTLLASLREKRSAALVFHIAGDTLLTWLIEPSGTVLLQPLQHIPEAHLAVLVQALRRELGVGEQWLHGDLVTRGDTTMQLRGRWSIDSVFSALSELLLPRELVSRVPTGSEIVIVPDGPLAWLPFAVLPCVGSGELLGDRYALRLAPSLTVLAAIEARPSVDRVRRGTTTDALIVANPNMPPPFPWSSARLPPLDSAQAEGEWVARFVGAPLLTAGNASESAIRSLLPSARLIHLATHASAYPSQRDDRLIGLSSTAWIALAPDAAEDGWYFAGEVEADSSTLIADLVVLSACETALGTLTRAEGVIGLPRAFLSRGARTVLVSLWLVDDGVTRLLMERFYRYWLDLRRGLSKAQALRLAQADLRTAGYGNAYDWAAFQLIGAQ